MFGVIVASEDDLRWCLSECVFSMLDVGREMVVFTHSILYMFVFYFDIDRLCP